MKIVVDPPSDDMRRERVERAVFTRLDAIREALDAPDHADRVEQRVFDRLAITRGEQHVDFALRPRRRWIPLAGVAFAAAAILLVIALRGSPVDEAATTHHVATTTPVRWEAADAIVDASPNTSVEQRIDDTGVTLALARGKVECEVEPIAGRKPYRVVAGEVTVTVVGTRFTVESDGATVRVAVERGKVRVTSRGVDTLVVAGESWTNTVVAVVPAPAPVDAAVSEDAAMASPLASIDLEPKPAVKPPTAKEIYDSAAALERRDPVAAGRLYRRAANMGDARYAALALYSLADVERMRTPAAALKTIDEYLRRFPAGVNVEDLLWTRADIYRATDQTSSMKAAANDYLRRFPAGTYAAKARKLAR